MKGELDLQKFQTELSNALRKDNEKPLLQRIQSKANWRINLCPTVYKKRLNDGKQACELITRARVFLCNVYYPSSIKPKVAESDFIASEIDMPNLGVVEYWFLFYSGQFLHLLEIPETSKEYDKKLREWAKQTPLVNTQAPYFIHIAPLLDRFGLFFNFISNLCQANLYDTELKIDIELKGIKDFSLIEPRNSLMSFTGNFVGHTDTIANTWFVQPEELSSKCVDLALEAACYFVSFFGWDKPPVNKFKKHLQQFLYGISS
ncbi:MAG: hypothetical protein MUO33_06730 [Sedimentisphaerales bacterium]|nr:hypothetical protein [Sedimentisphaerales bacterium]